jgi:hypothetical protein
MHKWILIILALTFAACGGGEDETEEETVVLLAPAPPVGQTGGNTGNPNDFCHTAISVFWCDDASNPGGSSTSAAVHSQVTDTEPNDDLANAVLVHWPRNATADQRIGFGVEGDVSGFSDVADFFAFTPERSADFTIGLCEPEQLCGPHNPGYSLPVTTASLRILDQSGAEIFSETLYPGSANVFEMRFESGVLYYAVVVAENVSSQQQPYQLTVGESVEQTAGEDLPTTSVPEAPQLAAFVLDSHANVQFDWTPPTYNEDGTQLSDLAGFNLYLYDYVREGDAAERHLIETIDDPSLTTRTINLEGYLDWHVSITAFNEVGVESAHSNGAELVSPP